MQFLSRFYCFMQYIFIYLEERNSGYSACRGKNPPENGIFRCTKRTKTAFLRLFRSIFLFFADKNLRTECWRFHLTGFTERRKKRRTGDFRLLLFCEKAFRLSF